MMSDTVTDAPVRYFVTGPFSRTADWSSARNIHLAHAKEVGRSVTLCGLSSSSWVTLWETPFDQQRMRGACTVCRMLVE